MSGLTYFLYAFFSTPFAFFSYHPSGKGNLVGSLLAAPLLRSSGALLFHDMVFVSHVPALATLQIASLEGGLFVHDYGEFILFLLIVSQGNDVCQYLWGKSIGRHQITPHV